MSFRGQGILLSFDSLTGVLMAQLSSEDRPAYGMVFEKIPRGRVCAIHIAPWYPARSTGPESQNNKAWGLARQIAREVGEDVEDMFKGACVRAEKRGFPVHRDPLGLAHPKRWSECDTAEASMVIEQLLEDCAFLGLVPVGEE